MRVSPGGSWPDGQTRYARDGAQPASLARAAGGKGDASGGSWPDGQPAEMEGILYFAFLSPLLKLRRNSLGNSSVRPFSFKVK